MFKTIVGGTMFMWAKHRSDQTTIGLILLPGNGIIKTVPEERQQLRVLLRG